MPCFLPAPEFYVFVMHNLHFLSTPIYLITMVALLKETSKLFQKYKYFLIAHLVSNFASEFYVTFLWLPTIHLPYEVYMTTGWLAEWGVSGICQFMATGLFLNLTGVSILEMFYHRFQVVVIYRTKFYLKIPTYCSFMFRFLTFIHLLVFIWGRVDNRTLIYQENKRQAMFKKEPNLSKDLGCFTVSVAVPEDPIFVTSAAVWAVLVILGFFVILSCVLFIDRFMKKAQNLSKQTKKLQRMLIWSLLAQVSIHAAMIAIPISVQIYEWIFIIYDNNFGTIMLFFVAYHGFFSTLAMVLFTTQIRRKVFTFFFGKCIRNGPQPAVLINQVGASSTNIETTNS